MPLYPAATVLESSPKPSAAVFIISSITDEGFTMKRHLLQGALAVDG